MKKISLFICLFMLICVFAISVNADYPKDLFSDVTIVDSINKTTTYGYGETDFSRVVLLDPQTGNYVTYPTYYIFDKRDHSSEGNQPTPNFSYLNNATNRTGTEGEFKLEHIICIELPEVYTGISSSHTKTNSMANLQYIKFSKSMRIIHGSAFKSLSNLSLIEFQDNTEEGAKLEILAYSFDNCDSLVKVDFPVQLKALGERSFGDNALLEEVNFAEGTDFTLYNSDGTIKASTLYAAFIYDPALKSLKFPKGITSTGPIVCGGCSSLEYVYIPASCTSFGDEAFKDCKSLKVIEFEEDSQLQTIGTKAISESSQITSLVFPNTFLSTSGEASIRNLTNLTYLNFGASFTSFTGKATLWATNNANLIIVMPATFDTQYASHLPSNAVILYTGTQEQANNFGYTKVQSYDEWIKEGSPNGKRVVYGYSVCEAFYNGEHDYTYEGSFQNDCVSKCGRCGNTNKNETQLHKLNTVITYANGYLENGNKYEKCANQGCDHELTSNANPLILFAGISTNNKNDAICVKYAVDKNAIAEYRNAGNTFIYGVVACVTDENDTEVLNQDLTSANGKTVVAISMNDQYSAFDFVLRNFKTEHYETNLVMCAFVSSGTEVDYINTNFVKGESMTVTQDATAKTISLKTVAEYIPQ